MQLTFLLKLFHLIVYLRKVIVRRIVLHEVLQGARHRFRFSESPRRASWRLGECPWVRKFWGVISDLLRFLFSLGLHRETSSVDMYHVLCSLVLRSALTTMTLRQYSLGSSLLGWTIKTVRFTLLIEWIEECMTALSLSSSLLVRFGSSSRSQLFLWSKWFLWTISAYLTGFSSNQITFVTAHTVLMSASFLRYSLYLLICKVCLTARSLM